MKKPDKKLDALYAKKISTLEQKNSVIRHKIESYDKSQSNWESFRREFNRNMNELGKAFNDLTAYNKKQANKTA